MAVTLHRMVQDAAMHRPDGAAVRCDSEGLTWSELARRSNGVARALLDTGVGRGDRVAVLLGKSLKVPAAFYGVLAAGARSQVPAVPGRADRARDGCHENRHGTGAQPECPPVGDRLP